MPSIGPARRATGVLGLVAVAAVVTAAVLVAGPSTPAGAATLERFSSCEELQAWTTETATAGSGVATGGGLDVAEEGSGALGAPAPVAGAGARDSSEGAASSGDDGSAAESSGGGDTGGTNTVVAGVDEIDVIDRVGDDRLLVSRNGALALVDLTGRQVVGELLGLPYDARVSVDRDLVWVAGTSPDGLGIEVTRVRINGDTLAIEGRWSTPGSLLDARRTGDRLHVVAVDHGYSGTPVPFEDGPVPCDQVWHPVDPATTPAATLVASLPSTGAVAPVAAAQVTGAAGNLLVTDDAVYIATETWADTPGGGEVTTGLHRFDLTSLAPTGSGAVPGTVAGRFALDVHDGHLRVATSLTSFRGGFIEGDIGLGAPAVDVAVAEEPTAVGSDGTVSPEPLPPETVPTTPPVPDADERLAEVFVLDTEGDLDLVGRTGRFGHDFETIQGVRFVGDVAYVVTFLQTDPFWVIDLSEPAAPAIAGELEIPGFSAYLHPVGEGRVLGFGPDGNGGVSARLFDVSDPTSPSVIDELRLGDDSPVVFDSHAFVGIDDTTFAVPVSDYAQYVEQSCPTPDPVPVPEPLPEETTTTTTTVIEQDPTTTTVVEEPTTVVILPEPLPVDPGTGTAGGSTEPGGAGGIAPGEPEPGFCEPEFSGGATGAAVLSVEGGRLTLVERSAIETDGSINAERIVAGPDGTWLLLSWDRIVPTDGGEPILLPADPNSGVGGGTGQGVGTVEG